MPSHISIRSELKQKAAHELTVFVGIALYLSAFFCAVVTYTTVLQRDFQSAYASYGIALINAVVIAKVVLIGEYAHIGKKHEGKPLLISSVYKAFLFSLLAFGCHVVEELVKQLFRGRHVAEIFQIVQINDLLSRTLIVFCTFIPFFAFRELQRVIGEENFRSLFFRTGAIADSLGSKAPSTHGSAISESPSHP